MATDTKARMVEMLDQYGGGDHAASVDIVERIANGALTLPPCFNLKRGTAEQTREFHDLARVLRSN